MKDEIRHFVEVGCVQHSCFHDILHHFDRVQIIEAHPLHVAALKWLYRHHPNVEIHEAAIWKEPTMLVFHDAGPLTYVEGIDSPAVTGKFGFKKSELDEFNVEAKTFDVFDDGTIDIIDIDVEGCEWYVISKMRSRPRLIYIEMKATGEYEGWYTNPFYNEIQGWMDENGYELAAIRDTNHIYRRIKDDQPQEDHQLPVG